MSFADPGDLRWVLYDGVYYPSLLLPDEGTPEGCSNVFFLGFESGAIVPNENVLPFDINDKEKANNSEVQSGVDAARNILFSSTKDNKEDLVIEDEDEAESRRKRKEERKREKAERKREKEERKKRKRLEEAEKTPTKTRSPSRSSEEMGMPYETSDYFGGMEEGYGTGPSSHGGRYDTVQPYMQSIAFYYETLRREALERNSVLSVPESEAIRMLERYMKKREGVVNSLEAKMNKTVDSNEQARLADKIKSYKDVNVEPILRELISIVPNTSNERERRKPSRFSSKFQDPIMAYFFDRSSEKIPEYSLEKLQLYAEQEQRYELFVSNLKGLGKLGLHHTVSRPFEQWNRTRDLMVLSNVKDTQPVFAPGFIPRTYSHTVKEFETHAMKLLPNNTQNEDDQDQQLQRFQSYTQTQNKKYPVYYDFNDLTINVDENQTVEEDNYFAEEDTSFIGNEKPLPSLSVGEGLHLESELLAREVETLEEGNYQSVLPEYSVGVNSESTWYERSQQRTVASSSASSAAHSTASRRSGRGDRGASSSWRDSIKRCVMKRLLYHSQKGENALSLSDEELRAVAKKLVDRTSRKIIDGDDPSSLLKGNDQNLVFDKNTEKKLIKSVDTYVERHYKPHS